MSSIPEPRLDWAVERCKRGDRNAYRAIADAYSDRLFRIAVLITRDQQLAEDAMQEALVRGWQNINRLRDGTKLGAWLNRILLNEVKKQTKRKRHPESPIDDARNVRDPGLALDESVLNTEIAAHLRVVLDHLNQDQRTAVVLRFYLDYTVPEIAEATGWAEGTIKSRLNRAMRTLKQAVGPELVDRRAPQTPEIRGEATS
jgi:RNA polymerase sigma-70 factor (ECF subfamily)